MDYSIVIPLHNEEPNVGPLVEEIVVATRGEPPRRIVLVDDASTDRTVDAVHRLQERFGPLVTLVRNRCQCGQSTAVRNGVQAAESEWIVTMDGDRQNDPADIPGILERLRLSPVDDLLVIGHRVDRRDTWLRRRASRIANAVRGRLLHDRSPDTGCGLKAFKRSVFLELPYFDHMHRFMPALMIQHGGRVESVPVRHRPRTAGESKYGILDRLWVGIVDLFGVAWLARRNKHTEWTKENA
jgi:dolichol-phosphate mannosyltransferase